jgi:membrane-bound lytic murein transglycosylase D
MRLQFILTAVVAAATSACFRSAPLPPRPEVIEIEPLETIGADFSDPTGLEPAPFPEPAGDAVPTSDATAPSGLDLSGTTIPLEINRRVQYWLDLFSGREREHFALYLSRKGRYEDLITTKLRGRGLPEELLYLAMIESGFSPVARSRASAVGMWQFIAGTARIEGLQVTSYLDERRDVARATDAAINHLEKLYNRFDSWYLAAAAYNSGEGRVSRALTRRGRVGLGGDSLFWRIHDILPRETRDYVPKLLAATIIARNPHRFGFQDVIPLEPIPVERITVPDATDFDVIAEAAGVAPSDLTELNPHLPRQVTPPGRATSVYLPEGTAAAFEVAYAQIPPDKRVRFLEHSVRRGETLSQIASRYGTTVSLLQQANGIRQANRLSIGQRLIIPRGAITRVAAATPVARTASAPARPVGPLTYRVRRGDTLWAIARRHGVSMSGLMELNALREDSILKPGDRIVIRPES